LNRGTLSTKFNYRKLREGANGREGTGELGSAYPLGRYLTSRSIENRQKIYRGDYQKEEGREFLSRKYWRPAQSSIGKYFLAREIEIGRNNT